ncbi:MAG: hypothetical protein IJP55_07090, partial [Bacteroidales bacterium]|nr:hypothetical protein [Bacteroidales bacterium]
GEGEQDGKQYNEYSSHQCKDSFFPLIRKSNYVCGHNNFCFNQNMLIFVYDDIIVVPNRLIGSVFP